MRQFTGKHIHMANKGEWAHRLTESERNTNVKVRSTLYMFVSYYANC